MSEQPTENGRYATLSGQMPAIQALAALVQMFPTLPSAYLTVHAHAPAEMWLQPDTGADVEAWRVALQVPPTDVTLHAYASYCSIEFDGVVCGVKVKVFTSISLAPDRARLSPAEDAARYAAAQLAEQHHQVDDAAEPDPAAYIAVQPLTTLAGGAA